MWDIGARPRRIGIEKDRKMKKSLVLMEDTELAKALRRESFITYSEIKK